jgi:hypothetical protein
MRAIAEPNTHGSRWRVGRRSGDVTGYPLDIRQLTGAERKRLERRLIMIKTLVV